MIAIDLGSNSLRCIEYNEQTKTFEKECEYIVKTADNLHLTGKINHLTIKRIVAALLDAKTKLNFSYHDVNAVTTEAMRQATNSDEVIEKIYNKTGITFKIISSEEEALLAVKAVVHRLNILNVPSKNFVLIDVGGGSTEVSFFYHDRLVSKSFKIGIVSVAQQCDSSEDIQSHLNTLFVDVDAFIKEVYIINKPEFFIATAGTPTTMAAYLQGMNYKTYDVTKINGFKLSYHDTNKALNDLMQMSEDERKIHVGVGRESLILAGIMIVQKLYKSLDFEKAIVIDDGLREGIALGK
jgi:exopolyphosphatase / guanosine-5'-triphosphate,3'-diphosphate pyrophosphatase